jgi:hypothetical protein
MGLNIDFRWAKFVFHFADPSGNEDAVWSGVKA